MVFGGNLSASVLGLLYLAVLTSALSLEKFGLYVLYGALIAIVGKLVSFQTWQAQIHYGTAAAKEKDNLLLYNILFFGWLLDLLAGLAGFLIALALVAFIPELFGLPQDSMTPAAIAATILIFNWISSPTAFFRLYDRFVPQALYQNISNFLQLVSVSYLWAIGEERLIFYIATTSINNIIGQVWFFAYAYKEAKKLGLVSSGKPHINYLMDKCPGILRFTLISNFDGMIRVVRDADIFIVNAILGVQATALFKIAKTLTGAFGKLTGPFYQSIYPELSRLLASNKMMSAVALMKQASMALGLIMILAWVGFFISGPYILHYTFGIEYLAAFPVSAWCMAAMVIWGIAQPISPIMLAMREPELSMKVHLVTTLFYIILLTIIIQSIGLVGAGIALFVFYVLWGLSMYVVASRQISKRLEGV